MSGLTIGAVGSNKDVPQSVEQITKAAQDYDFSALVPLKFYLRTANTLLREAEFSMRDGDDEMTYLLLFRYSHLVLAHLSTHPEYKKKSPQAQALERQLKNNFDTLDTLKPRIAKRYEEYQTALKRRRTQQEQELSRQTEDLAQQQAILNSYKQIQSGENADLAAQLAQQQFSKRSATRKAYPTGLSQQNDQELSSRMQAIRDRVEPSGRPSSDHDERRSGAQLKLVDYSYPLIRSAPQTHRQRDASIPSAPVATETVRAPLLPPKPSYRSQSNAPLRPEKQAPTLPTKVSSAPTNESSYSFAPGGQLENGKPLRTIFLPRTLRTTFLRLAQKNTSSNLETCGFLCGTLRANALFISTLVVPSQTSTSDTCEMNNESQLFDYVDSHSLMVLGWIHTHPTQTCFMSSRDLHTHAGYQMMLAESVAIVCAPSKGDTSHGGDWGVYRLTDPPGKMTILQCDKPGLFHPHEVENVYTDAIRPGHVMELNEMDFEIVDLRQASA